MATSHCCIPDVGESGTLWVTHYDYDHTYSYYVGFGFGLGTDNTYLRSVISKISLQSHRCILIGYIVLKLDLTFSRRE